MPGNSRLRRHPTLGRAAIAAGIAVLIAGCAAPTTYKWDWQQWSPNTLGYAAGQGALLTEIRGNPFDAPKGEVDAAITSTMYKSHFGPPVPFVTEAPQDYTSPYRVVMVFDPAETVSPKELCTGDPKPSERSEGTIKIAAAFCSRDTFETSVWGRVAQTEGPDDPEFQALIRQITTQLFPNQDPNERDNRGDEWISALPLDPNA